MANIMEIYEKYYIPEQLQLHMLRVAACSKLITDNWEGKEIDKEAIIRVSLLHDMGNIIKIPEADLENEKTIELRRKCIEKYGEYEHYTNMAIGKEEGLTEKELSILDGKRSRKNEETYQSDNFEIKICTYCDQRVAPDGVRGIKERLEEVRTRYKNKPNSVWSNEEMSNHLIQCALGIEKQLMEFCSLRPEDINDNSIQENVEKLKKYEIKKY